MVTSKKRIKITLDKYVANLVIEMSKEKHQSKSVVISNLVLDHEKIKRQLYPILTDKQFQQLSSMLQEINNQVRVIKTEIIKNNSLSNYNDGFYKGELVEIERKINNLDKELTEIVNNQC